MNYHINTLGELKNFAFKIPEEGMQTHYVPGSPNKIIKPASFEKRVFIKGSPLFFIDEEGTFICPLLPRFEKILRRENFERIYLDIPFSSLVLSTDYNQCIQQWNIIKSGFNEFYYPNDNNIENGKDLDK